MSNLKDLFSGKKSNKLLENATQRSVGDAVESPDYLKSNIKQKQRFIPAVDFSSASNFAIYGSAEKYYEDSYNYVLNEYPYDGSLKEKINWSLSGTYFDRHIFENEYPRSTGYINFGESYGSVTDAPTGYDAPSNREWIFFKGNNANSSLNSQTNPKLTLQFDNLNIYNTASQGLSNLELEGSGGLSVEFWLRKPNFDSSVESRRQVLVDTWNSASYGTPGYGRFRVEISGTDGNSLAPNFHVELLSQSAGFSWQGGAPSSPPMVILSGSTLTGSWTHFALTFVNESDQMMGRLYTNGNLTYSYKAGTTMGTITGSMIGQIGSLVTAVSGGNEIQGDAKFSGSLDEFRFWKTKRNATQIGQHWFTQVGGGTNSDLTLATSASTKYSYENPTDLGVYYKFNEGIIDTSNVNGQDAVVIDYAGRVTNGAWTGYTVSSRNTGSAIISASAAPYEFEDPILYSINPRVSSSLEDRKNVGKLYDATNNSSMMGSLPQWIVSDDLNNENGSLSNLTQIMSSYFDTLYLQTQAITDLKNKDYISGSDKPAPFASRFIDSSGFLTSEILSKATDLEYLDARNNTKLFTDKIDELKNLIYQNVYNNLIYIYKTKGTMKSFRNLIRCFGVDNELINIRLYGDEVTYNLLDNYENTTIRKRYANFHTSSNFSAVVFQQTASGNTYSRGYISSSAEVQYRGNTYELESFFPKDKERGTPSYFNASFQTASIFGCHTSGAAGTNNWGTPDYGQFQVQSVRTDIRRKAAFFQLTCSNDGQGVIPKLTSSVFQDVYDGTRWNFGVRIKPKKYPLAAGVSGSDTGNYDVEFSGYNYVLDVLNNSFVVTASVSKDDAQNFLRANKRFFVGAHRTNTTGDVLQQSNAKSTSLRVWMDYLTSSVLQAHAIDVTNYGSENPYRDAYLNEQGATLGSKNVKGIPQLETLILNWDFENVTASDSGGNFTVPDVSIASSGTNDYTSRWGWLGPIGQYQHTGYGYGFTPSSSGSIDRRYVHTAIQQPPEVINSSDMISLIDQDQNMMFVKDSRPEQYFFAFEKSMYNIISKEMIDMFATIVDFNNLIGQPVNRYRPEYKDMQKLRQLYFERVQNTVDLDKFVEYFKWLDSALSVMLQQLVPGSARFSENLRTMVESHVLERNKYQSKFPTLEMKQTDPEAGVFGINEMLYSGKRGTAPIPTTATGSNCEWWLERADRNNSNITSGDATVNDQRNTFRLSNDFRSGSGPTLAVSRDSTATTTTYEGQAFALRNFTKIYRLDVSEQPVIHGGSNFAKNKTVEYTHEALKFDSSEQLSIAASSIPAERGCNDVIIPNSKERLDAKVVNSGDPYGYTSGKDDIFAPFSLYSSSVTNGYVAEVASEFRTKTEINNYHDDIYGDDKGIPAQGPFTERHVGGRQHRHLNINTSSATTTLTRAEAWNLEFTGTVSAAEPEKSMFFQDGGEHVLIPSSSALPLGASADFSVSFWVNPSSATANRKIMISRQDDSTFAGGWHISQGPTYGGPTYQFQFYVGSSGGGSAITSGLSTSTWHHIVATYNQSANELYLYRNTVQSSVGTVNPFAANPDSTGSVTIGATLDANNDFDGYINNVALFNKVLSTAEVSAIYNSGCPEDMRGLSGITNWWRLGDGDTYPTAQDTIGSDDGTMTNMVADDIVEEAACATTVEPAITTTTSLKTLKFTSRTAQQPRATMIRDAYAKRPVNIANLKWGTSSAVAGNYRFGYEILQTSGRTLNNRFFIANGGFSPTSSDTGIFSGAIDYALPRFDLTGTNKSIFVERFNAPGGPEVSSRGCMDVNAEEFSVYNELNYRNLMVREALDSWLTEHCGQFGISPTGSPGDGTTPAEHTVNPFGYGDVIASYHKVNRNPRVRVALTNGWQGAKSCSLNYDNWYVQHPIPQSDFQYAWITASVSKSACDALGHIGAHDARGIVPFSVPSGVTSITQSAIPFISASVTGAFGINADFVGLNTLVHEPVTSSTNTVGYPLTVRFSSYRGEVARIANNSGTLLNSLDLHRNGPYGRPTWKQIRTGETPVARYHKRNNILSVGSKRGVVTVPHGSGSNMRATYFDPRTGPSNIKNFVEPPVVFKYRPLISDLSNVRLQHSYANNKCLWSQQGLPLNNPSKSIGEYLNGLNYKTDKQIYDKLRRTTEYQATFQSLIYSEVIYPRAANTGLARTRGRTQYAETADLISPILYCGAGIIPTASLSIRSNGIDRGPNIRRTFWKDNELYRNRYGKPGGEEEEACTTTWFTTTISNSCGFQNGHARSVWCFGEDPLVFVPPSRSSDGSSQLISELIRLSASSGFADNNALDTGELNSFNLFTVGGLLGTTPSGSKEGLSRFYTHPTASAYYYWLPYQGLSQHLLRNNDYIYPEVSGTYTREMMKGLKWTAAIDSGKSPGFDSYEAFAEDIRGLGKAWTVLPEFRISDNMNYYARDKAGNFNSKNDKFLLLNGAHITQSAIEPDANPSSPNERNFDSNFFKEYSFSDFQKYFGCFQDDNSLNKITLNCTAVKKMLPYKGFYPADRTTQLVSLFSGALGHYVTGGALSASGGSLVARQADVNVSKECEQSLALQSALQPWFAPGILYNTIKSGIAVDWPIFTGSYSGSSDFPGGGFSIENAISGSPNRRLPFNTLLNPLKEIPVSASTGGHELLLVAPTYARVRFGGGGINPARFPYAEIRGARPQNSVMDLYSSAMHNFLAEIPNFFLRDNKLSELNSLPQSQLNGVIEEGKVYVMDAFIDKTNTAPNNELVMMQDYYNGYVSGSVIKNTWGSSVTGVGMFVTSSYNGKYFGPPFRVAKDGYDSGFPNYAAYQAGGWPGAVNADPAYAPVTPPYFYGKAQVRMTYTARAEDRNTTTGDWDWSKILTNMTMSFKGADDPRHAAWTWYPEFAGTPSDYTVGQAWINMMDVTASLQLEGVKVDKADPTNPGLNRWSIAPFMETPVLDFSGTQTPQQGYGRGMWSGYGEIPKNDKGLFYGIQPTPNLFLNDPNVRDMTVWFRNVAQSATTTGTTQTYTSDLTRKVGEIADSKVISEAVVAIPFCTRQYGRNSGFARTVSHPIMGKRFFSLGNNTANARNMFDTQFGNVLNGRDAIPNTPGNNSLYTRFNLDSPVVETSVSQMGMLMNKYILPPELDFAKNGSIEPFAMYIMEFEHTLSEQDLVDIWQGLMPTISTTAELDNSSITHTTKPYEFFGGKKLPPSHEIRWMVFKIKKKANINYWSMTPAAVDDISNPLTSQDINPVGLQYSYNWPYDYFSLVELGQVETVSKFSGRADRTTFVSERASEDTAIAEQGNPGAGTEPEGRTNDNSLGSEGSESGRAGASSQDPGYDPNDNSLGGG